MQCWVSELQGGGSYDAKGMAPSSVITYAISCETLYKSEFHSHGKRSKAAG